MQKNLVINADDYGFTEGINESVMECYSRGAVTDISFLACGDSFEHATELAEKNNLRKIGIHLALTESFRPVSSAQDVPTLIDKNGKFLANYRLFLIRYFTGAVKNDEIYTEFKNQIRKVKKAGFEITHLDSHEHIHVVPGILKIALALAKEEGIKYIRFPLEKAGFFAGLKDLRAMARNILLSFMCGLSKRALDLSGVKHNDYFIGHARAFQFGRKDLFSMISGLKEGLTELSCHPGKRREETNALCDKTFTEALKASSVNPISY